MLRNCYEGMGQILIFEIKMEKPHPNLRKHRSTHIVFFAEAIGIKWKKYSSNSITNKIIRI